MNVPDLTVGKRLFVGEGSPYVLGVGPLEQRGSAYIEGALVVGDDGALTSNITCCFMYDWTTKK